MIKLIQKFHTLKKAKISNLYNVLELGLNGTED